MRGRRRPDLPIGKLHDDLQPGDHWIVLTEDGDRPVHVKNAPTNLTGHLLHFCSPIGGVGSLTQHTVRINDDDTITVAPGDGSSNSILFENGEADAWHGYIDHGEWKSV